MICVNPYKNVDYSDDKLREMVMLSSKKGRLVDHTPHIYSLAINAYHEMITQKRSQSILISGDGGSGKSHTCKAIIHALSFMDRYFCFS